jgi:hypothetical protein
MPDTSPQGDRSIRKIPITTSHRSASIQHQPQNQTATAARSRVRSRKRKSSVFLWGLLTVLACAVAGLLLSTLFEKATVSIVPKTEMVALPPHLVASEGSSSVSADDLGYTLVLIKSIPEGYLPIQGSLVGGQIAVVNPFDLAKAVAWQTVPHYTGEPVTLVDPSSITLSVATNTPVFGHMLVTLTGSSTSLVWRVDTTALTRALLGTNKKDFASIIKSFGPGIADAYLTMRPFWKATLPSDGNKLMIAVAPQASINSGD